MRTPMALVPRTCARRQVIEYMLASNEDGDEGVALESAEFWMAYLDCEVRGAVALEPGGEGQADVVALSLCVG
jgi:hypothetical protein